MQHCRRTSKHSVGTSRRLSSAVTHQEVILRNKARALAEVRDEVFDTILLPRLETFIRCIKKNRAESVDEKAIKLYQKLHSERYEYVRAEDLRHVWFDDKYARGEYYKVFHKYLKRWGVESNLDFWTKARILLDTTSALTATTPREERRFNQGVRKLLETFLRSSRGGIVIDQKQRAMLLEG